MIISEGQRKANKQHRCEGFDQIDNLGIWHELVKDHEEKLPEFPHTIRKGETYYYQTTTYEGMQTFKSCIHCWNIIKKHKLFAEI